MEITSTSTQTNSYQASSAAQSTAAASGTAQAAQTGGTESAATVRQDSYVKSTSSDHSEKTGIYSKESISKQIGEAERQRTKAFTKMIRQMFQEQGAKSGTSDFDSATLSLEDLNERIRQNFSQEELDAATESVSDGGMYSVDAVATRIMDFAMALAGDDPTKISALRDAVTTGFGQAADTLGLKEDDMPSITKDTYTEIMKRFDDWEKSYETEAE